MAHDLADSLQCVVVLTDDWKATTGMMHRFARDEGAMQGTAVFKASPNESGQTLSWKEQGEPIPVVVGKKGLAPGIGIVPIDWRGIPYKKEGDDRAPAGIFRLSSAFGYAESENIKRTKLPYLILSDEIEGIDDPKSRYYNKLIDRSQVAQVDWQSSEKMKRADNLYKWGIFVDHNPAARPGAGSCIFLHVWKDSQTATTGCTAMAEGNIIELLHWLDPARHPILAQMPRSVYQSVRAKYKLPPEPQWPESHGSMRIKQR